MIRHAAVCIVLVFLSSAVVDDVMILLVELVKAAAELRAKFGRGRDNCLANCDSRENMSTGRGGDRDGREMGEEDLRSDTRCGVRCAARSRVPLQDNRE